MALLGDSLYKRSDEIVAVFEGIEFTAAKLEETISDYSSGQKLKRHPNGGGWVPYDQDEDDETKPFVAESVFVGPFASVVGNARAIESVRLTGESCMKGNSRASGSARLRGNAEMRDNSEAADNAVLSDKVILSDNGKATGYARLSGYAQVCDNGWISGYAKASGYAEISGNQHVREGHLL